MAEAATGLVELIRPVGGRVLVDIRDQVVGGPEMEAAVVGLLYDIDGTDGDICDALASYAASSGLTAHFYVGRDALIVELGEGSNRTAMPGPE